jgi:hypothetical protein
VKLVQNRLASGQAGEGRNDGLQRVGTIIGRARRRGGRVRVGLEEDEITIHLSARRPTLDGLDHRPKWLVVEHPAVDQIGPARIRLRQRIRSEVRRKIVERRPRSGELLGKGRGVDGLKPERQARRRSRGQCEGVVVGRIEVVFPVPVAKLEEVAMLALDQNARFGQRQLSAVAAVVGNRDRELEQMIVGHQGLETRLLRVHFVERFVDPPRHLVPVEERLGASRGGHDPEEELGSGVLVRNAFAGRDHALEQLLDEPLAPELGPPDDLAEVAVLEPEVAKLVLAEVVGQGLRKEDPVDSARRATGDRVDYDPRACSALLGDCVEQVPVGLLALLRCSGIRLIPRHGRPNGSVDLLCDSMHVDRKRDAAVADKPQAQLSDTGGGLVCLRTDGHQPLVVGVKPLAKQGRVQGRRPSKRTRA